MIKPNPGPQERFLASPADIVIYGGAAGGGKSMGLLMEPLRHIHRPNFGAVGFRRTTPQIKNEGGLWDTSMSFYPGTGGVPKEHTAEWEWPSGATVSFSHLQYETTITDWDGSQIPLILFDELIHFTARQFWYMLSRNRSAVAGIRPYIRASTNPKKDSWVRHLIDWWIGDDGFPIAERSGLLRYFVREDEKVIWVGKHHLDRFGLSPKSITFIPAKVTDNPVLMKNDPGYMANLAAQSRTDRARLMDGNWDVDSAEGLFDPDLWIIENKAPPGLRPLRYWDRAATEVSKDSPDPDWTAGALVAMDEPGDLWILDVQHFRGGPAENERRIKQTADIDGRDVTIGIEMEGGSAGKDAGAHYQGRVLKGFTVRLDRPSGSKVERAKPWAALAENRKVHLLRGSWNHDFISEAKNFPMGKKDQIDAVSGAYALMFKRGEVSGEDADI